MNLITSFLGIQIPTLIVVFFFAGILQVILNKLFTRFDLYRYVWHPGLFRTALFFCIFSSSALVIYH